MTRLLNIILAGPSQHTRQMARSDCQWALCLPETCHKNRAQANEPVLFAPCWTVNVNYRPILP